jgi:uncharacterized protein with HEPN domain
MIKKELQNTKILYGAIDRIIEFTKEMKNAEDLISNMMAWDAVKMNLVLMFETSLKIDLNFRRKYKNIEWEQIENYKSTLENSYLGFDKNEIWFAIHDKFPSFKREFETIVN